MDDVHFPNDGVFCPYDSHARQIAARGRNVDREGMLGVHRPTVRSFSAASVACRTASMVDVVVTGRGGQSDPGSPFARPRRSPT